MSAGSKQRAKITIKVRACVVGVIINNWRPFSQPFKHLVAMDPSYAENTWNLLRNAIHEIHKKNASNLSFEELYRYVFCVDIRYNII